MPIRYMTYCHITLKIDQRSAGRQGSGEERHGCGRHPCRVSCPARAKFYSKKVFGGLHPLKQTNFPFFTHILLPRTRRNRIQNAMFSHRLRLR